MGLSRSLIKNNSCSSFFTPKNSSLSTKNTTMSFFSLSRYSSVSSTQRSINSPKNYFLNPPMKSIELMIPKNNVVINKNNFKLRKKVLDINKAISLNENSHIGNNKNENKQRSIFDIKEYLHFSPTNRSVIRSGLMQKIIDKHDCGRNSIGKLKKKQIEFTKRKNEIECYRYINELKHTSQKIKDEIY